jgi:hypothetical protein
MARTSRLTFWKGVAISQSSIVAAAVPSARITRWSGGAPDHCGFHEMAESKAANTKAAALRAMREAQWAEIVGRMRDASWKKRKRALEAAAVAVTKPVTEPSVTKPRTPVTKVVDSPSRKSKMGRPLKGDRALTPAERARQYRARRHGQDQS